MAMLHAAAPQVAAASVDPLEEKGAAVEAVPDEEASTSEELQRALEASLQSYEQDQLRQVMEDTEPKAWTHALPQALAREPEHTCGHDAKDAHDVPVTLRRLRAPEKHTGMPPSKRARYAWSHDCSQLFASADPRSLTEIEAAELWQVLFSPSADEGDVERWLQSSFVFVGGSRDGSSTRSAESMAWACPWGLRQELGGPCGVLAAVQGFIVHALLWGPAEDSADESLSQVSTTAGAESDAELSTVASSSPMPSPDRGAADCGTDTEVPASPCDGPGTTSSTAPDDDSSAAAAALVECLAERFEKVDQQELLACALARILYAAAPTSRYTWAEVSSQYNVIVHEFVTIQALASWLVASGALEMSPCPVLSFVYSLVLTRGIEALQRDMDDASAPLVGVFGHCAQELVNLCLTGRAVTNVFDGNVTFEDESDVLTLQGIQERPLVGFLSALEPLKLCEVGRFLKQPRYPLWVAGTSSHYSLFFAGDCQINHLATTADEAATAETPLSCYACTSASCESEALTRASATLLHFNGKDFGAERPELTALSIRTVDPQEQSNSGPVLLGVDDSQLFAEVLRSRWPTAEVSCLQVSGSSEAASPPRLH
mmetsp:Transcript_87896/g.153525  ORF Transcript_87896/g.153525 Transcript_87896/m.153525 type:complete len:602 (+) Transcript_87896:42-1847(+)